VAVGDRYFARIALQESIFQWFRASQEKSAHLNKKEKPQHVVLLIICGYYMSKI
jgi:hypothetical protein